MILPLLLLAADPGRVPTLAEVRHDECREAVLSDAAAGEAKARAWVKEAPGEWGAAHCLGFALAQGFHWPAAADAFDRAVALADQRAPDRAATIRVEAGEAALAAGDPVRALARFDAAAASGRIAGKELGQLQIDRGRALVAAKRPDEAVGAFDLAHQLAPEEPAGWLLSATLARRRHDLVRADADIAVAARLAPRDPAVALEIGNIAAERGNLAQARAQWQQAIAIDADSLPGRAARRQLDALAKVQAQVR